MCRDLQLAILNACLLVYYPRENSGLNCHKDNEPIHASEQVIILCHNVRATLLIQDNSQEELKWIEGGDFYVFKDQRLFRHGVDIVESTIGGRWAFTFHVFKLSLKSVKSVPTLRSLVAVAKASPVSAACKVCVDWNAASSDSIARKFPYGFVCSSCDIAYSLPSDSCKNFPSSNQLFKTIISSSNDCNLECNIKYSTPPPQEVISLKNFMFHFYKQGCRR